MVSIDISKIPALAELDRIGVEYVTVSDNEVRLKCPAHEDNSPSCCLNIEENKFICQASSCGYKGDIVTLLGLIKTKKRAEVIDDLQTRYDIQAIKALKPSLAEDAHANLGAASKELLKALVERGINAEIMDSAKLGYVDGRITIPIYDANGYLRNIKKYLPGAPGNKKMQNTRGYGQPFLYQESQLEEFDKVIICGGELKAAVAKFHMNPHGFGAVSSTHGEGHFETSWIEKLKNKQVWICLDIDPAGQTASTRLANILSKVTEVRIVRLDLSLESYPKGDLNDYFGTAKKSSEDLLKLLSEAEIFRTLEEKIDSAEAVQIQLRKAASTKNVGKRIKFEGSVAALADSPYLIPKKVAIDCSRDTKVCALCPIYHAKSDQDTGMVLEEVPPISPSVVEMVNSPRTKQRVSLMHAFKIPHTCRVVSFKPVSYYRVADMKLSPRFDVNDQARDTKDNILVGAYLVSSIQPEANASYEFEGTVHPHPNTQEAIVILDKSQQLEDSLASYQIDEEGIDRLKRTFMPDEWTIEGIDAKLEDIYSDLEDNVTRIYGRREMHILFDLTYHSALLLEWDGNSVPGWVNSIIIGDSSQGKTEVILSLNRHYRVGERIDCKNSSKAGLIGGLEQISNRWYVRWGALPANDKGLVVLEEAKGLSTDDFAGLTDCRSSGIAEIAKIKSRKTYARTRLITVSNPRSGRAVNTYSFGVESIAELIGAMEDVRRFDIGTVISESQVSADTITKGLTKLDSAEHRYTSDLCSALVLFGWTRTTDQIEFEDGFKEELLEAAKRLTTKYTERFPLVDKGTIRYKLLRLSTSLAIRTASINHNSIIVRKCHITWIEQFLDVVYSNPVMGYLEYSRARERANSISSPEDVRNRVISARFAEDLVQNFLYTETIRISDVMDWQDIDKDSAQSFLSFFVRKRALRRIGSSYEYCKTAGFIDILRDLDTNYVFDKEDEVEF